jgi:hypothetical protein
MQQLSKEFAFSSGEKTPIGICTWCCGDFTAADETPAGAMTCRYCYHTSARPRLLFSAGANPGVEGQLPEVRQPAEFGPCGLTSSGPFGLDTSGCFALLPPPPPTALSGSKEGLDEVQRRSAQQYAGADS